MCGHTTKNTKVGEEFFNLVNVRGELVLEGTPTQPIHRITKASSLGHLHFGIYGCHCVVSHVLRRQRAPLIDEFTMAQCGAK